MKLITIILLTSLLQVSAATFGQRLTLAEKNVTLEKMFREIRKQTGYGVLLSTTNVNTTSLVDANFNNATVEEVMAKILSGSSLTFSIEDKTIMIKAKEKTVVDKVISYFLAIEVKGKVVDNKGNPIPGVVVREKGGGATTSTGSNGEFQIRVNENATLVFSFIGYNTLEQAVNGRTSINVTLREDVTVLKQVEIVSNGFQTLAKSKATGATVTLKAEDIKIAGVTDISRMLEGRAAGVSIQNVSGTFGAAPKIRVRGVTSLSGENKPLWVVDGVVLEDIVNVTNQQLTSGDASTLLGSSVAGLNMNDVETFDILKDAASVALYGARAMNGVIVITTKKGKLGAPVISYTGNFGLQLKPTYSTYDIMNSADQLSVYAELERKGMLVYSKLVNEPNSGVYGKLARYLQYELPGSPNFISNTAEGRSAFLMQYANTNTNWFDVLFKNSLTQEHSISVSNGTDKATSYFSAGFFNDNGWTVADKVKRFTFNGRQNYTPSEKLSFGFLVNGSIRRQMAPGTENRVSDPAQGTYSRDFDLNPFSYALNTSRVLPVHENDGSRAYFQRNYAPFNILTESENNYMKLNVLDIKLQGNLAYKFNKNLSYEFLGAYRFVKTSEEHMVTDQANQANAYRAAGNSVIRASNPFLYLNPNDLTAEKVVVLPYGGFYNRTDRDLENYTFRNQLNYKQSFNEDKHVINVIAGQELKYTNRQRANNIGAGYQYNDGGVPFVDPNFIKMMVENNAGAYYGMNTDRDRFLSFYSSANYTFLNRYTVSATTRIDGSNRLGSTKNRWLPTYTFGAAWNMEQEDFLKDNEVISHMKLNGSYGLNASTGSATNSTVILRAGTSKRPYLADQQTQIAIDALENSDLTWEKQYTANIGTDIGFFKERFNLTVDVYNKKGFDLIGLIKTAGIGGETYRYANYANLKSWGIDLSIGGQLLNAKDFSINSKLIFSYSKNKVTNVKGDPTILSLTQEGGGTREDYPINSIFSLQNAGLDPTNGVPRFINENGVVSNGVYLQSIKTQYLKYEGPADPTITGGWDNTFRYKGFSVNALITYQAGNKVRLRPTYTNFYTDLDVSPNEFKGRWQIPGDELLTNIPSIPSIDYTNAELARATVYPYANYNYSSARVVDGGFVRLKKVTVTYAIPSDFTKKIGLKNSSISFTGNNLWLIYSDKNLHGQDPEFFGTGGVALPVSKQFTLALQIGL